MRQRNIGVSILLTIVTCGIYSIYWFITVTNDTNFVSGHQQDGTSGGVAFLLNLVTCGLYGYYWAYKQGEKMNQARAYRNVVADSSLPIIYLVLAVCGLQIVNMALMQNELNKMCPQQM